MNDLERALLHERMTGMPRWQVRHHQRGQQPEPMPDYGDTEIARHRKALDDYYTAMEETA